MGYIDMTCKRYSPKENCPGKLVIKGSWAECDTCHQYMPIDYLEEKEPEEKTTNATLHIRVDSGAVYAIFAAPFS